MRRSILTVAAAAWKRKRLRVEAGKSIAAHVSTRRRSGVAEPAAYQGV